MATFTDQDQADREMEPWWVRSNALTNALGGCLVAATVFVAGHVVVAAVRGWF